MQRAKSVEDNLRKEADAAGRTWQAALRALQATGTHPAQWGRAAPELVEEAAAAEKRVRVLAARLKKFCAMSRFAKGNQ